MTDELGELSKLYRNSYALLVGVSRYDDGHWTDLGSIPSELDKVEIALKQHGFNVERVRDPGFTQLKASVEKFINNYGYQPENRLLVFFSGHGHTWREKRRGFLVPKDAPAPATLDGHPGTSFLRTALHISQVVEWSTHMTARHALFLFDSCFSGTVFQVGRNHKVAEDIPPFLLSTGRESVREFIAAGRAGDTVPARSFFVPAFVDGIRGEANLVKDAVITGTELGLYLQTKVSQLARQARPSIRQTPQHDKHWDIDLRRGDFVFLAPGATVPVDSSPSDSFAWGDPWGTGLWTE